jgi:hypothetical protein
MKETRGGRAGSRLWVRIWLVVAGVALGATGQAAGTRLRIRNGHGVVVALGGSREAASGVRPGKQEWVLEVGADLAGATALLDDVTPGATASKWTLPVSGDRIVLDAARFRPSHVYRLEARRDRVVLGSVFVYLYPPPVERVKRLDLDERADADKAHEDEPATGFVPAVLPKGGL